MKTLIFGHGVNDFNGTVTYMMNGKRKEKSFYQSWKSMLKRCYSGYFHQTQPTYIGCSVCKEWIILTNFKTWHDLNFIEGLQLDKDIIKKGNKIYCPKYCRYISSQLNTLLNDSGSRRGKYPQGVNFDAGSQINPYIASVAISGKKTHIGMFPTVKQAFTAYANAKHYLIIEAARKQTDIAIREGLVNHAKALLNQAELYVKR